MKISYQHKNLLLTAVIIFIVGIAYRPFGAAAEIFQNTGAALPPCDAGQIRSVGGNGPCVAAPPTLPTPAPVVAPAPAPTPTPTAPPSPTYAVGAPTPLGNISLQAYVGRVIKQAIGFVGVLALLMFVYGGVTYMTAAGDDAKVNKAKATIIWSVLGLIMVFGAYAIVSTILGALQTN